MSRLKRRDQGGFIITIELLLVITILGIGSLVGLVAIRDALFKRYVTNQSHSAIVVDSQNLALGEAVDYDEHDAPRLFYIDRSQARNYRVLIGIRDDRFSSREPLYYAGNSCQGTPCIKTTSDEVADNKGADGISGSGSVSYFNALQGQPNYAVGRGEFGLPGALYRESPQQCPLESAAIGSRWASQKVVRGTPCEPFSLSEDSTEPAYTQCLINSLEPCECPAGYTDEGDVLAGYLPQINNQITSLLAQINPALWVTGVQIDSIEIGTLCCPELMAVQEAELVDAITYVAIERTLISTGLYDIPSVRSQVEPILAPLEQEILCAESIQLKAAISVPAADDPARNALEVFVPPFQVNLPADAGSDSWSHTAPRGEGGSGY